MIKKFLKVLMYLLLFLLAGYGGQYVFRSEIPWLFWPYLMIIVGIIGIIIIKTNKLN